MAKNLLLQICNENGINDGVLREFIIKGNDKVILASIKDAIKARRDQITALEIIKGMVIEPKQEEGA